MVNIRHAWLDECAVRAIRKKMKLSSDGGDSGSKKCKWDYDDACGVVWWESGVRPSDLCWCVWQECVLQLLRRCFHNCADYALIFQPVFQPRWNAVWRGTSCSVVRTSCYAMAWFCSLGRDFSAVTGWITTVFWMYIIQYYEYRAAGSVPRGCESVKLACRMPVNWVTDMQTKWYTSPPQPPNLFTDNCYPPTFRIQSRIEDSKTRDVITSKLRIVLYLYQVLPGSVFESYVFAIFKHVRNNFFSKNGLINFAISVRI
jgi:hypothetical protein